MTHDREAAMALTMRLGKALHVYGTPAHRLEEAMEQVSRRMGLAGQFFSTPTSIIGAFGEIPEQRSFLVRVAPGDVNLEKLSLLDGLLVRVIQGHATPRAAMARLEEILAAPPPYGTWLKPVGFALASGAAARLLAGGWKEALAAVCVGGLLGALARGMSGNAARAFSPLASTLAALLSVALGHAFAPLVVPTVLLASLIALLPGLTLTVAMNELATLHLVSGTARLMRAIMDFLLLGFGVGLGQRLGTVWFGSLRVVELPVLEPWGEGAALVVAAAGFTLLFQARPRDFGWILGAGALAYWSARQGAMALGGEIGGFVGALLVGLASNLYARVLEGPVVVPLIPGIMLLVPGSVGFLSLASLLDHDVNTGVQTAFRMGIIASSIVTGLLLANLLLPPRKAL